MDPRLKIALSEASYRAVLENQKEKLKERLKGDLLYPFNGGYFELGPVLEFQVNSYLEKKRDRATLLDINLNPVEIEDLEKFQEDIQSIYFEAVNRYVIGLNKLKNTRKIEALVDFSIEDDIEE